MELTIEVKVRISVNKQVERDDRGLEDRLNDTLVEHIKEADLDFQTDEDEDAFVSIDEVEIDDVIHT